MLAGRVLLLLHCLRWLRMLWAVLNGHAVVSMDSIEYAWTMKGGRAMWKLSGIAGIARTRAWIEGPSVVVAEGQWMSTISSAILPRTSSSSSALCLESTMTTRSTYGRERNRSHCSVPASPHTEVATRRGVAWAQRKRVIKSRSLINQPFIDGLPNII